MPAADLVAQFDTFIRRDPARRGLIGSEPLYGPLCPGHLAAAATHLAEFGTHIGIVTGFFIPRGDPPAAETDGPLGAVFLAAALKLAGMHVHLITDQYCFNALRAAADTGGCKDVPLYKKGARLRAENADYFAGPGQELTHLIAIERVGPSHTLESLQSQPRNGIAPIEQFAAKVPPANRNRCHNMRGEVIDEWTGDLHTLFEELPARLPQAKTIGIGDGGNEIGMGAVPWEDLERRLSGEQSGRVPCRIATDWNILAGTSNWGAYALAAATLLLRGQTHLLAPFDREHEQHVLEQLIANGPAVDGMTRRREATVDGLPFLTYIQPLEGMRRLLEFDDRV